MNFNIKYKGLLLIPSKSATTELFNESKTLWDVKKILENGYEAPRKRAKDTIEKWLNKGKKTYNVVVVKSYNYSYKKDVWLITHFGKFTKKKKK